MLSTIGREIFKDYELRMHCTILKPQDANMGYLERYRILAIEDGAGIIQLNGKPFLLTPPLILCLDEKDEINLVSHKDTTIKALFFHPSAINEKINFISIHRNPEEQAGLMDYWCLRPFHFREDTYQGILSVSPELYRQIVGHMTTIEASLSGQKDWSWPCRSRSYMIELLFLLSRIYDNPVCENPAVVSYLGHDIHPVVLYLHTHYRDKIMLEDLTREFHVNRTTLNEAFKKQTGFSIMSYLIKIRVEMACSMLRNTTLPITEIMTIVGFHDDAHFLRTFKKTMGLSPSEYRNQNCWMLKAGAN
ncbi:MAG: AraC family transcriptional regulator [Clostridia bacterium]|nr:AraC family transcriptional regulator [Clostridia bacterium]